MAADLGPLDRLTERAETLAGAWAGRARGSTTVGRERALLRMFGINGLDAAGRPLAWSVVDRYLAGGPDRLGGGIVLPFAMALAEYDLDPQRLALDVASGAVDLGMEAALLREPDRRAIAEEEALRLVATAIERIDANRTARSELIDVLGEPRRPWIGAAIGEPDLAGALDEARAAVDAGVDLLDVEVPIGRELSDRLKRAGLDVPAWRPKTGSAGGRDALDQAPTGSQRALGGLRRALDEAAAQRRGYVRLGMVVPPLGAPEGSVVAGFERIDVARSDPLVEIVDGHVAPDRALADHAFGQALLARAGVAVVVGAGPLVVGPDLAQGVPSDPAVRAGRALALQLVAVAIARGNGLPNDQILIGALTPWLVEEREPVARAIGEIALRRALLPEHGLVFDEPRPIAGPAAELWPALVSGVQPGGGATAAVVRYRPDRRTIRAARTAATVANEVAGALKPATLAGAAQGHARATAEAALRTLERLADDGWRAVIGDSPARAGGPRIGADAVAERSDPFDPLARELSRAG